MFKLEKLLDWDGIRDGVELGNPLMLEEDIGQENLN